MSYTFVQRATRQSVSLLMHRQATLSHRGDRCRPVSVSEFDYNFQGKHSKWAGRHELVSYRDNCGNDSHCSSSKTFNHLPALWLLSLTENYQIAKPIELNCLWNNVFNNMMPGDCVYQQDVSICFRLASLSG